MMKEKKIFFFQLACHFTLTTSTLRINMGGNKEKKERTYDYMRRKKGDKISVIMKRREGESKRKKNLLQPRQRVYLN